MGVMLALDRSRQSRSRGHGQHARNPADRGRVDAITAFPRCDASGSYRCLGRLARTVLAGRLLLAAISPAYPAGEGAGRADRQDCESSACEHGCHSDRGRPGRDGTSAA